MKILWRWITTRKAHQCKICKREIRAHEQCWYWGMFQPAIQDWVTLYVGEECEWVIPLPQRRERDTKVRQLPLL